MRITSAQNPSMVLTLAPIAHVPFILFEQIHIESTSQIMVHQQGTFGRSSSDDFFGRLREGRMLVLFIIRGRTQGLQILDIVSRKSTKSWSDDTSSHSSSL